MTKAATDQAPDPIEVEVDAAIAACDGDLRATIRALLVANSFLAGEIEASATSHGYSRGRVKPK